ncbi:competence protein ComEC [Tessaracoccus bendigoensis DSM 12906]|uniref:Competence protein ComEC n=1 Tax=Tessaracoccus bendigoensis DSM 12906 TaxID=1123357 RepID=A0A1M6D364_9ACTN|nr:ComEC/Rec2 family competence protein [Tessaracoccus bendigoensis]SHI67533.1 competence protein ComEC [Tessaracoccus bendigoensis DSM 12906]
MNRHDLRLLPVAVAVWAAAWIGTSGWMPERAGWVAGLVGLLLIAVMLWRAGRVWTAMVFAVLALTLFASGLRSWQRHSSPVSELAAESVVVSVEFSVNAEPAARNGIVVAHASLVWVERRSARVNASVPVVVLASGEVGSALAQLEPGARYRAVARLGVPEPGEREAAVLSLQRIDQRVADPGPLRRLANAMRGGLRDSLSRSPPQQAALVPSLVVGDTTRVDDEMRSDFKATGLTHLMAVSGANLSLMLGVLLAFVRLIGVRGWWVRIAAVAGVGLFVLVCGQEPSVLRATAMGLVALAATGVSSGSRSTGSLCLAVVVLVWCDPWLSRSVGFALSVCACAGIVVLGPWFRDALVRWCPRWIAEAVAVSLAAQLVTQPIVTAISDEISVVGVAANVLAAPFVGPTTVLGLSAAVLSGLGPLGVVPAWLAGWCSQPILWVAQSGASVPSATWQWQADLLPLIVLTGCVLLSAFALARVLRSPWGGAGFIVVLVVAGVARPVPLGWPGQWSVAFCDVGQGDATVVRAGPGAAILVDAGPEPGPTIDCLAGLGVRAVPMVVLTHYHADHVGGAATVIARFKPKLVLVRGGEIPTWLLDAVGEVGGEVRSAAPGEVLQAGLASWTTVSAPTTSTVDSENADAEGPAENNASVVGVATSGGIGVLLAGDAEPSGQSAALRSAVGLGLSLEVDVLKLPHHGSSKQESRFFDASGASLAVASAGLDNDYGHPARATLELAESLGMAMARTDLQGTIAVSRTGEGIAVRTQR